LSVSILNPIFARHGFAFEARMSDTEYHILVMTIPEDVESDEKSKKKDSGISLMTDTEEVFQQSLASYYGEHVPIEIDEQIDGTTFFLYVECFFHVSGFLHNSVHTV
jgi:hypothetical protein